MGRDTKYDDRRALLSLREWGVDVVSLPETNKNWNKEWLRNKWRGEVTRVWRHAKVFFTSIDKPAIATADHVQGGACLIVTDRWASRIVAHRSDDLGRWVWVTLRGQQNKRLTIVSMYRPNPGGKNDGPTTVWAQQRARMQEKATGREEMYWNNPRTDCLTDFKQWSKSFINKGHKMAILTDTNQSLNDTRESYNLKDLIEDCNLISTMESRHKGNSLRSVDRGSTTINHILAHGIASAYISQAGQLPFGLGFSTDHRGEFADFNGDSLLRIRMGEPAEHQMRRLSAKNAKHSKKYLK